MPISGNQRWTAPIRCQLATKRDAAPDGQNSRHHGMVTAVLRNRVGLFGPYRTEISSPAVTKSSTALPTPLDGQTLLRSYDYHGLTLLSSSASMIRGSGRFMKMNA